MKRNCFCGRKAAWGVIDKWGFMEPGTLCPSHYISWTQRKGEHHFIFHRLSGGEMLMRQYFNERGLNQRLEEGAQLPLHEHRAASLSLEQIKIDAIVIALERNNGHVSKACRELQISKATFYRQIRKHKYKVFRNLKYNTLKLIKGGR